MRELKLRVTEEEYGRFADEAYLRGRMKHQAALKQAVETWIASQRGESHDTANLSVVSPAVSPLTNAYVADILQTSKKLTAQLQALAKLAPGSANAEGKGSEDQEDGAVERAKVAAIAARHLGGPGDPDADADAVPKGKRRPKK